MKQFKLAFAVAIVAVAFLGVSAQAANIQLTIDYAGSYDAAFTPLPGSPPAPLFSENAPHPGAPTAIHVPGAYHQFDVYMRITNTIAGEDFQTTTFDMLLGPGVTVSDAGWVGDAPLNDPPGPPGNEPIFTSGDFGVAGDLKAIGVVANSNASNAHTRTHNTHPGEADSTIGFPTKLGSAYVFWDGTFGPDDKSWIALAYPQNTASAFSTVIGSASTAWPPGNFSTGPREEWVGGPPPIPFEVGDLDLVSGRLPGALIVAGPLPTNDDDDPDLVTWALVSLIGPDGAEVGASVDPLTGVFMWQTAPTEGKGLYTATIQGVNDRGMLTPEGTDNGLLTFDIVPEPATFSLLGLAMLGMLGFIRRR